MTKEKKRFPKTLSKIISYILPCFFAASEIGFFIPMDIFFTNAAEMPFPMKTLSAFLWSVTAAAFAVLLLCCFLIKGKANKMFRSIIFGISAAVYVQSSFLAANMGELNGEKYSPALWRIILSAAVWLAILAVPFVILKKFPESFEGIIIFVSAALAAVQGLALNNTFHTMRSKWGAVNYPLITEGEVLPVCTDDDLDLYSEHKNLLIILADEYDSFCFEETLKAAPDSVSEFDGFTLYTDTVGKYLWTAPSVAYIMTGDVIDGSIDKSYEANQKLFETLSQNYKTNFYSDITIPPAYVTSKYADNVSCKKIDFRNTYLYSGFLYRLSLFRCAPEVLKPLFWSSGENPVQSIDLTNTPNKYDCDVLNFYNNMPRQLKKTDDNVFKYIYLFGLHNPRTVTAELERGSGVSPEEQSVAVNKTLNEYFKILKENGVYDNSEIIVMADHGLTDNHGKMYPLFMYKPANQTEDGIKISNAPISFDDMYPTFLKLAGGQPEERTIFDIGENEQRTRHFNQPDTDVTENIKRDSEEQ